MQTVTIDYKKNPGAQDLFTDKDMGSKILMVGSLKETNDEGAVLTIDDVTDDPAKAAELMTQPDDEEATPGDENEQAPEGDAGDLMGSPNTPGGSRQQDIMAAEGPTT